MVLALVAWTAFAGGARGHGTECQLTLVQAQRLIVDPACNTCDSELTELLFRNDSTNTVKLHLSIGELTTADSHKATWSQAEVVATAPREDNGEFLREVRAGQFLTVTVRVFGLKEIGEWEGHVFNWGTEIGKFAVVRGHRAFNVNLDLPDPDHPLIEAQGGVETVIPVKNQDAVDYTVQWVLAIPGMQILPATVALPGGRTNRVKFSLPPGSLKSLSLGERIEYLFKGKTVDASLLAILQQEKTGGGHTAVEPAKIFPIKVRQVYFPEQNRVFWRALLILVILISGAGVSLFLNAFLPNQSKRRDLKGRLKTLEAAVRSLPMELSSRLRVLVGVERKRLSEELNATLSVDSEFTRIADDVSKAVDALEKRVKCIQQLGSLRTQFDPCDQILLPTLLEQIESRFNDAINTVTQGQFGDLEIATMQSCFKDIQDLLQRLDSVRRGVQEDAVLAADLKMRFLRLQREVLEDAGASPRYSAYIEALPFLFEELRTFDANNIGPREYARLDQALYKIALLQKLVAARALLEASTPPDKLQVQEHLVISDLQQTSWTSLQWAALHVREMQEGLFKGDVRAEIDGSWKEFQAIDDGSPRYQKLSRRAVRSIQILGRLFQQKMRKAGTRPSKEAVVWPQSNGVSIDTSSSEPRPFQEIKLKLRFARESLNCAAARQEFVPMWDFGHGGLTPERGWEVTHYFPAQAVYTVKVAFKDRNGGPLTLPDNERLLYAIREFSVGSSKDQSSLLKAGAKLGIARLSVALIPVVLALYSGASDQLSKLDVIPGMIAVFLLGFSSDQVKNLLTK